MTAPNTTASPNAARRARMAAPTTTTSAASKLGTVFQVGPLCTVNDYCRVMGKVNRRMLAGVISPNTASRWMFALRQAADLLVKCEELRQLVALKAALEQVQSQSSGGFAVLPPPTTNGHDVCGAREGELLPANGGEA